MILGLEELDYGRLGALLRLYHRNPLEHCYLAYDLLYERDSIDLVAEFDDGDVKGYALLWHGPGFSSIHVWGSNPSLLHLLETKRRSSRLYVHLYNPAPGLVSEVTRFLENMGYRILEEKEYLDMVLREEWYKPFHLGTVVKLGPHHAPLMAEALRRRGLHVPAESIEERLRRQRCYGVIERGRLASMACRYLMMPEVGCVGSVYTEPMHRGKGYARAVVSAVSGDIVASGAAALLHVEKGNEAAIRAYKRVGYRVVGSKTWIVAGLDGAGASTASATALTTSSAASSGLEGS